MLMTDLNPVLLFLVAPSIDLNNVAVGRQA